MSKCIEPETILNLGQAVQWHIESLQHLSQCVNCRNQFQQMVNVRETLTEHIDPGHDFTSRVMHSLPHQPPHRTTGRVTAFTFIALPALTSLTVMFAAALATQYSGTWSASSLVSIVVVTALGTMGWNITQMKKIPGGHAS